MDAELLKAQQEAHKTIVGLWKRYQDLMKEILATQGKLADLQEDAQRAGQDLYELYKKSDNGLSG